MVRLSETLLALALSISVFAAELDPRTIGPTAENVRFPTTAFSSGRFLTVWLTSTGGGWRLFGSLSDGTGKRTSSESFPIVPDRLAEDARLIGTDDGFALFWRDGAAGELQMARLDLDGRVVSRTRIPGYTAIHAAWNGRHFVAIASRGGTLNPDLLLLDGEGTVIRRESVSFGESPAFATAMFALSDGSVLVANVGWSDAAIIPISPEGRVGARQIVERAVGTTSTDYRVQTMSVAPLPNGGAILALVSSGWRQPADIKLVRLDESGTLSSPSVIRQTRYTAVARPSVVERQGRTWLYFRGSNDYDALTGDLAAIEIGSDFQATGDPVVIATEVRGVSYTAGTDANLAVTSPNGTSHRQVVSYALRGAAAAEPQVLSLTPSTQNEIRLGSNGAGFVAVWNDFIGSGTRVRAAAVDSTGNRVSDGAAYPGDLVSARLASSPTDHLLLRATSTETIATRIAHDGTLLQDVVLGPAMNLRNSTGAVWTGAGYLVAAASGSRLLTFFLPPGAATANAREIPMPELPPNWGRTVGDVQVAFDGRTALVIWSDFSAFNSSFPGPRPETVTFLARRLSPTGIPLDAAASDLGNVTGSYRFLTGGSGDFVLYSDFPGSLRLLDADGPELAVGPPTPVAFDMYRVADLSWNGREYMALLIGLNRYATIAQIDRTGRLTPDRAAVAIPASGSHRLATRGDSVLVAAAVSEPLCRCARACSHPAI